MREHGAERIHAVSRGRAALCRPKRARGTGRGLALRLLVLSLVASVAAVVVPALTPAPASAESSTASATGGLFQPTRFFVYAKQGEFLDLSFAANSPLNANLEVRKPNGDLAFTCLSSLADEGCRYTTGANPPNKGRWPIDQTGVWIVDYNTVTPTNGGLRHYWALTIFESATGTADSKLGRVWVERYDQYQSTAQNQQYWLATREGYRYQVKLTLINGVGSTLQSNGFGMVEAGTCTPTYRSAEGTNFGGLDPTVEYSADKCGDAYKIFFASPATDLPASAQSMRGTEWITPTVVPPSVANLTFDQDTPTTRAGDINFDLAGVNGGYTIQIDVNANGVYTDPVDRIIPWGSPRAR